MPNLRAQLLETIRDAYPENFGGLDTSKAFGENVFNGPKPHPNAVLNLFVQQKVTSALPMAYYMAARRGSDSLMDTQLPPSETLSGQTLRSAIRGLIALREMELTETHRIAFMVKDASESLGCFSTDCPSRGLNGLLDQHKRTFDWITGSAYGLKIILRMLSRSGDTESNFCWQCGDKIRVAHAEVMRKARAALPEMFGLTE